MSSGPRRDPHGNTSSPNPYQSHQQPRTTLDQPRSFLQPTSHPDGGQPPYSQAQLTQARQSSPMALQPPLLPSLPPSFGHHRSAFSVDSSSSRTSFPSPREPQRRQIEQVATPDTSPTWPSRRGSVQKRAFRQRRKDPSCDACRERKVKCDATESRSCTECANRGVRCQFTKDTNRRMSSIKQVQELERQLAQVRHENERLKLKLSPEDKMDVDLPSNPPSSSRTRMEGFPDYTQTRRNIRRYARRIFRPPATHRPYSSQAMARVESSMLPDQQEIIGLVEACRNSFVSQLAPINWDSFLETFHSIYATPPAENFSRSWISLLFSVLAIGQLQSYDKGATGNERRDRAHTYISRSSEYISFTDETSTLDHCRAALMLSVYHVEANQRSAGWTWLSAALSFAFDLGLHDQGYIADARQSDLRRQLWWSVYSWERLLCLEMSQPLLINDDDCELVALATQSSYISDEAPYYASATRGLSALSRSVIPLMRLYGSLRRLQRNNEISSATLMTFESLLEPISASYPEPIQRASPSDYDGSFFTFTVLLSNASFSLHRPNLSPMCTPEQRSVALNGCASAAHNTMRCIRESLAHSGIAEHSTLDSDSANSGWAAWLRSLTSSLTCTHLWRCILVLAFGMDFESAMVCAKASGAVAGSRDINLACGRHLIFFLELLGEKLRLGGPQMRIPLEDAEMLAYVSGDLQGDGRASWIWRGEETEATSSSAEDDSAREGAGQGTEEQQGTLREEPVWPRVESLLRLLEEERTRQRPLPELRQTETPVTTAPSPAGDEESRAQTQGGGNTRMSIANIIQSGQGQQPGQME